MQIELQIFLALFVAHLIGDFPLQSRPMVAGKVALAASAYVRHGLVHLGVSIAALAIFLPASVWRWPTTVALAFLIFGHLLLDLGRSVVIRSRPKLEGGLLFAVDQAGHITIIALASMIIVGDRPDLSFVLSLWIALQDRVLVISAVLLLFVFPIGYLIRYLLDPLSEELADSNEYSEDDQAIEGLTNAGLYIGWLERGLLIIAFAVGSITAVGLIVGAKSIVRYPKFQSRAFAEYFLIGTFISVASAALGGWILRLALTQLPAS